MFQDRKDYQRQYYQTNKERIKLKRLGKTDSDAGCLFSDERNDSNVIDNSTIFDCPMENVEMFRSDQHPSVESDSTVEQVNMRTKIEKV